MTYKIGVFGSGISESKKILPKIQRIGKELGQKDCLVITGACPGIPFEVAKVAYQSGKEIWGFSPYQDQEGQKQFTPDQDLSMYAKLFYVPKNYEFADQNLVSKKYRNVSSTATCDAGIIIAGRWGTLNEFTNLVDMGKIVGVFTGSGGVADKLAKFFGKIKKNSKAQVIFSDQPKKLVENIFQKLNNKE